MCYGFKAQLIRRWDAQRKVQFPIDVVEPFEIAASLAAAVLCSYGQASAFAGIPRLVLSRVRCLALSSLLSAKADTTNAGGRV